MAVIAGTARETLRSGSVGPRVPAVASMGPRVPDSSVGGGMMELFAVVIMVFHAFSSEAL